MANSTKNRAPARPFSLFQAYGIELEYMIVDRDTLAVRPACDSLLHAVSGDNTGEALPDGADGAAAWSNELVLHVVEFKTARPVASLSGLDALFAQQTRRANDLLARWNARLMPTAMHPWMNPETETFFWPYACGDIYQTFHRIFNCRRHGWANMQSSHINLPFANDDEFSRLHAAIRIVLPLLPALAASSPILDGKYTGCLDNRVRLYSANSLRVPQMAARIIPEPAHNRLEYDMIILAPLFHALKPFDPDGILQYEWANARGAIARFARGSIEIRLLDAQECPKADLAIVELVCAVIRSLTEEHVSSTAQQNALSTEALYAVLMDAARDGDTALLDHPPLARCLGVNTHQRPMSRIWRDLAEKHLPPESSAHEALSIIFHEGCLARRIINCAKRNSLLNIYKTLCDCLAENRLYTA